MLNVMRNLDWSYLVDLAVSIIPAIICITIHEMCHGLAAYALGDNTAETQNRLSLNPLRHIDIMGLIMLVVFKVGWARPVPVDMMNFRHPKRGMAMTALAGPVSNFVLAALLLFLRGLITRLIITSAWGSTVLQLMDTTAYLSLCLGLFNLIPIPPMDGSKVLFSLLPDRIYMQLMRYEKYGMILIIIIMLSGVINTPLSRATLFLFEKFFYLAQLAYKAVG